MEYLELSIKDTIKYTINLARKVEKQFEPDAVIFISKGSYVIGEEMSKYFSVPLIEIFAERKGNTIKDFVSNILYLIPKELKLYLRSRELNSNFHSKNKDRNVYIKKGKELIIEAKKILIVDDSVDSGNTAKQVSDYIKELRNGIELKFAALNYFEGCKNVFNVDYSIFENRILIGPWSKDSIYYKDFMLMYKEYQLKENYIGS